MFGNLRASTPLLFCLAAGLSAQTTASLQLTLLDEARRARPQQEARIESLEHAWSRSVRTDLNGRVTVFGLLPGRYRIQGRDVILKADERAVLTIVGSPASAVVQVEASPLRTERSSVAVQTTLTALDLVRLPGAPHRYVEQAALVPGLSPSGKPEPVVLGSMLDANAFLVDGMMTNLSSTGRFGMNLSSEILESQTVTTGGHKAEIGFASGGVFSMVTKSGTNTFQGALFGSRINRSLNSRPEAGKANFPEERPTDGSEWGFSLGGPLIQDRLFFFAAFNRQMLSLDWENVTPLGGAPRTRSQVEDRVYRFTKLTWLPTPDQRLELSWFGDPVTQHRFDTAGDSALKDEQMAMRTRGGNSFLLKHNVTLGAALALENTLGLHRTDFHWSPMSPEAGPFRSQLDAPGKETFGAYSEERLEKIRNLNLRSELSISAGEHQIKTGFQGLQARFTSAFRRPSLGLGFVDRASGGKGPAAGDITAIRTGLTAYWGSSFNYAAGDSLVTPSPVSGQLVGGRTSFLYQRTLSDTAEYGSPLIQRTLGLFAQDDWQAAKGLTFNLGLRVDRVSLDGETGQQLYSQTLISPRFGLSWDPRDDGRNRLFAYYGQIYSPITAGNLTSAGATTGGPAQQTQVWIPSLQDWRTYKRSGTQGVRNIALGDLNAPRTDLVQAGFERLQRIPGLGEWILEAVFTRKTMKDLVDTYDPAWGYLPELNAAANASAGKKIIANLPGLERTFNGYDLTLHRRFEGGHRFQMSWSHGDLRGNSEVGAVASATGKNTTFAQIPSLREDYRLPQYSGPLNESVKHALKAFGSAQLTSHLELSGFYTRRNGLRYSPLLVVSGSNVLAPGSNRGECELPWVSSLDLSLAGTWIFGRLSYRASLDVFNALNSQPMTAISNVGGAFTPGNVQQPRGYQGSLRISF